MNRTNLTYATLFASIGLFGTLAIYQDHFYNKEISKLEAKITDVTEKNQALSETNAELAEKNKVMTDVYIEVHKENILLKADKETLEDKTQENNELKKENQKLARYLEDSLDYVKNQTEIRTDILTEEDIKSVQRILTGVDTTPLTVDNIGDYLCEVEVIYLAGFNVHSVYGGTCFFMNENLVATNYHVATERLKSEVYGKYSTVKTQNGIFELEEVMVAPAYDFALYKTTTKNEKAKEIFVRSFEASDYANPESTFVATFEGEGAKGSIKITHMTFSEFSLEHRLRVNFVDVPGFSTTPCIIPGNSGGPHIAKKDGALVGQIYAGTFDMNNDGTYECDEFNRAYSHTMVPEMLNQVLDAYSASKSKDQ